jgi:hypothetical protein
MTTTSRTMAATTMKTTVKTTGKDDNDSKDYICKDNGHDVKGDRQGR